MMLSKQPARDPAVIWNIEEMIAALSVMGRNDADAHRALARYWRDGTQPDLSELVSLRREPRVIAYNALTSILGVGPATATAWIARGIMSLSDLRRQLGAGDVKLTHMQRVGLRYHADLTQRIPRADVAAIVGAVCAAARSITPRAIVEAAGSYRRGALSSGDVDIITVGVPLNRLAQLLATEPSFVETVISGSERLTILWSRGRVRQVDILSVPRASFPLALNYFTGGFVHNTWLRGVAKSQGYRLNQRELTRGGKCVKVTTERDIYRILGCEWVEPVDRR